MKNKLSDISGLLLLLVLLFGSLQQVIAQEEKQEEPKVPKNLKNTIRFNITNPLIFGSSYIFGYERVLKPNQSVSINLGTFSFPQLATLDLDSIVESNLSRSKSGFNISLDYRFYPAKVNKFSAPRGVYFGPYAYYANARRHFELSSSKQEYSGQLTTDYKLDVATLGLQLGYQFVFWNRLSLDMILIGPGVSAYSIKTSIDTTLDPATEEELFKKINDALAAKIPGYNRVIEPGDFKKNGTFRTTSFGYRYLIMLGFRF
jgi:hypothetical protein